MRYWFMLAGLLVAACSSDGSNPVTAPDAAIADCGTATPYAGRGPFVAGVTTLSLHGIAVEVFYPADAGAEAGKSKEAYDLREWLPDETSAKISDADAPRYPMDAYRDIDASHARRFPVVLFSHGLGGYRLQSSFLMTHLASWGFVVAAPEHPERGLKTLLAGGQLADDSATALRNTLVLLKSEDVSPTSRLSSIADFGHVAVSGHSMGGGATMVVAADEGIHTWFTLASPAPGDVSRPSLMMGGAADGVATKDEVDEGFQKKPAPKRYVSLRDAGHLAFTDICAIGKDKGGLFAIAQSYGVVVPDLLTTIGQDGCKPENLPLEQGWTAIDHYVTAQLRAVFGLDAKPVGLDQAACDCLGTIATFDQQL
jgi:hypothetical protein